MREGSWDEAYAIASQTFSTLPAEAVALSQSVGRFLASPARALCDLPAYATSSMDGWAVRGSGPWKIVGQIATGKAPSQSLADSECMKISTGGVIPTGATSVMPWENATETEAKIQGRTKEGENIRPAGVESKMGDLLIDSGLRLNPPMVGLLAATGHDLILVTRKPRIAIFFLGDELLHEGVPNDGSIRDALGPQLPALLESYGAEVTQAQFIKDDLGTLTHSIEKSLDDVDMIITTGGTADGPKDFVRPVIQHIKGQYIIDCVRVRPGYHIIVAKVSRGDREIPFVALPGNPQSALAALTSFGRPIIHSFLGAPHTDLMTLELKETFQTQPEFSRLVPGNIDRRVFTPTGYLGSAMLRGVAHASGFALVAPGGTTARWLPLPRF